MANAWRTKVTVEGRRPIRSWQEVARARGLDPNDPRFTFKLDKSHVMGPDEPIEVDTLKFVMGHLPKRSAGGVDGAGFGIYSCMDASSVKLFVQFSLSPPSPLEKKCTLGSTFRRLLVSGRGVGLDKKGFQRTDGLSPVGAAYVASRRVV